MTPQRFTNDQAAELAQRIDAGETLAGLAREFGVSTPTIRSALRRIGAKPRVGYHLPRWERDPELADAVVAAFAGGESQSSIARRLGISQASIGRLVRQRGGSTRGGQHHPLWNGGRYLSSGYWTAWVAPDDPNADMRNGHGYVPEHRLVMARSIGRSLHRHETVHHVNGDHQDNRIENLELRSGRHGKHVAYECQDCGSRNVLPTTLL